VNRSCSYGEPSVSHWLDCDITSDISVWSNWVQKAVSQQFNSARSTGPAGAKFHWSGNLVVVHYD